MKKIIFLLSITIVSSIVSMDDTTKFFEAIENNEIATVRGLITKVDINAKNANDDTALMLAVQKGNVEIIKEILSNTPDLSIKNKQNKSAITLAQTLPGDSTAAKTLKNQIIGLLNQYDFFQAIINKDLDAVKLLITNGLVDVNQPIRTGTPLLYAIQKAFPEMVEFFLHQGAKPDIASSKGLTPINLAQRLASVEGPDKKNYEKIIDLLNKTIEKELLFVSQKFTQSLNELQKMLTKTI